MSNEPKHTATATDYFVLRLGEEPKTASEKLTVVMMAEYTESLRAERDGLVEALRSIITQWDTPNWKLTESTGTIINQARQTIAKYEKP